MKYKQLTGFRFSVNKYLINNLACYRYDLMYGSDVVFSFPSISEKHCWSHFLKDVLSVLNSGGNLLYNPFSSGSGSVLIRIERDGQCVSSTNTGINQKYINRFVINEVQTI